jgi:plastocyanin
LLVAALVVPLQPPAPKQVPKSGVIMPLGAGGNSLNFSPSKLTVIVGSNNTITWTNEDNVAHTVKSETIPSGATPFSSDILNQGKTFTVTLTVPGTYTYECTLHPDWMQATIVVVTSGASSVSTAASSTVINTSSTASGTG